jgi:adenylate cyclase
MNHSKFKLPLWTLSIPIIALAATFQLTFDLGEQGRLDSTFLRENIYPTARSINGIMTNIKFRFRGAQPPKQKIIIVAADDSSVEKLGRWPWQREIYAHLVHSIFKMGARYVGLDVVFSEPEERIPKEVYNLIGKSSPKVVSQLQSFEGDPLFADVIHTYRDRLVLGYTPQAFCQPRYDPLENCPIERGDLSEEIQEQLGKFSTEIPSNLTLDRLTQTPLMYLLTSISNIPLFRDAADHAGFFFITPDPDGYIRRYPLFFIHQSRLYPSMALKMAELVKQDQLKVELTPDARIDKLYFSKSPEQPIPVTPLGYLDLNFRGKSESYTYVSAFDVLRASEENDPSLKETFKDSIVFFGATALGIYDMRAFPFDSNTPGVEGHATALDNLLSSDSLRSASGIQQQWLPIFLIIALGLLFAVLFSRFEAIPSLLVVAGFVVLFGTIDIQVLFRNNINLPSAFLIIEIFSIFVFILAVRYIIEEKNKKYVRMAFSHYLAPQVVDLVLKDPSRLAVGGERKEVSILFSDLRGFTTISETMDPKTLSQFLNEYLTEMTEIVFEFGGTLDKYIGDAVMAFWSAPVHQDDHAFRACMAGLKMQKRILEVAPDYKARYGVEVGMGVGINSGVVSVGNMGSKRIFEYTVIGDHVNLASRLEGLTRLYGVDVLSTRSTLEALPEALRHQIHYRVLDAVKVKGKKQASDLMEISLEPFPEKALELFYLAKEKFKARDWDTAREYFEKSNTIYQEHRGQPDPVCKIFMDRCEQFKKTPPAEGWDGTIEMRSK